MTISKTSLLPRFIAASGMTNLADGIAVVVWAWIASLLSRDPILIALMPIALRLPWFLFALPAGVVTDRVDRKKLILSMDVLRALAFASAAILVWSATPLSPAPAEGTSNPTLFFALLVCALLVGTAEVFRDNAAQTMLPALVPPDQLEKANGRLWSVELVGNSLLGPALGAFLIAAVVWAPFSMNAAMFALAALLIVTLPGQFKPARDKRNSVRSDLAEGFQFLRGAPFLQTLAVVTGIWNLLHQMVVIALILHVQENLGIGAQGYGLILAAGAAGGIAGGVVAGRVLKLLGPNKAAQWTTLASAIAFAIMPFAPNGYVLALILAVFEFTGLIWNTVSVSYRQRYIPDALLGRVNSIYRLLAWGMMPIGLLLSGLIVGWTENVLPRSIALISPFVLAAAGAALLTLFAWRSLGRGFKPMRQPGSTDGSVHDGHDK